MLPLLYDIPQPGAHNGKSVGKSDLNRSLIILGRPLQRRVVLCAVLGSILAGGCKKPPPPPREKIAVLATVYAVADIARQVGGDRVKVEWLIEAGQPPDELEETPDRRQKVRNANLVVTRGQFDSWTLEGTGNAYQDRRILRIDTLPASGEQDNTHFLWIDPRVALELANELSMRLTTLEPESGNYFSANARAFSQEVANLMEKSTIRIHQHGGGLFATLDRRFLPLARRFGLQEVALPPVSLTDPTPYGVKALRQATKDAGARAMFASARLPIALSQEWERRLSMPVLTLEPVGSSAGSGRDTYLAMLKYNLDQLLQGVEISAAPKPIELPVYADPPMEIAAPTPEDQARAEAERVFNTRPVFKMPLPPTRPATTRPFRPIPLDFKRPTTSPLRAMPLDGKTR